MSFFQNLPDFSLFQENYEYIFEFYRKRAFIWYINISSSIIFSHHHERIQIFNEDVKVNDNFTLNGSGVQKRSLKLCSPNFSSIPRYIWSKNHGEPLSAKMSRLPSKNGLPLAHGLLQSKVRKKKRLKITEVAVMLKSA